MLLAGRMLLPALVLAAGPVSKVITTPPSDPLYLGGTVGSDTDDQWNLFGTVDPAHPAAGIRGIDAEGAWTMSAGRPDVMIAIIDSGVFVRHPDLIDNI